MEYATDDGFDDTNPRHDTSNSGIGFSCPTGGAPCPVYDNGPNYQIPFKEDDGSTNVILGPGEELQFLIYYGAAETEVEADEVLAAIGAELAFPYCIRRL